LRGGADALVRFIVLSACPAAAAAGVAWRRVWSTMRAVNHGVSRGKCAPQCDEMKRSDKSLLFGLERRRHGVASIQQMNVILLVVLVL